MRNIFAGFLILSIFLFSCSKKDESCKLNDSNTIAPATEIAAVEAYLTANGITASAHPSGFFYKITQAGSGKAVVNLCSNITIKYSGKLTNGTVFDFTPTGETRTFTLGRLIVGWQKGIPLISSGGKITLYIPPSLGYGALPSGPIPGNSILIFDIELISVT